MNFFALVSKLYKRSVIEGFNITEYNKPVAAGDTFTNVWSRSRTFYEGIRIPQNSVTRHK